MAIGPPLLVLHLNGRAVEAEQLPHLVHREGDGAVDDLLLERGAVGLDGQKDERVAGHAVLKGRDRREDRGAPGELDTGARTGSGAGCGRGLLGGRVRHSGPVS